MFKNKHEMREIMIHDNSFENDNSFYVKTCLCVYRYDIFGWKLPWL